MNTTATCQFNQSAVVTAAHRHLARPKTLKVNLLLSLPRINSVRLDQILANKVKASADELQDLAIAVGVDLVVDCERELQPADRATLPLFGEPAVLAA